MNSRAFALFLEAIRELPVHARVLGEEALVNPPDPTFGYDATPLNALTFARMGVDGVHYAVLTQEGAVAEDSPIVEVSPMDFDRPVTVIAESFLDYLATGCSTSTAELLQVLHQEANSGGVLVPYLASHFDQTRLSEHPRVPELTARYAEKAVLRPPQSDA